MVLSEFLGMVGALVGSITGPVIAHQFGARVFMVIVSGVAGFLAGWVLGVIVAIPVKRIVDRSLRQEHRRRNGDTRR